MNPSSNALDMFACWFSLVAATNELSTSYAAFSSATSISSVSATILRCDAPTFISIISSIFILLGSSSMSVIIRYNTPSSLAMLFIILLFFLLLLLGAPFFLINAVIPPRLSIDQASAVLIMAITAIIYISLFMLPKSISSNRVASPLLDDELGDREVDDCNRVNFRCQLAVETEWDLIQLSSVQR